MSAAPVLPGWHYKDPKIAFANVVSLVNVCSIAIGAVNEWNEEIADRAIQDIKHVLEFAAAYGDDAINGFLIAEERHQRMTGGERNG